MSTGHDESSEKSSRLEADTERIVRDSVTGVGRLIEGGSSTGAVFDFLLATFLEVTRSEYGFIGEVFHEADGTPYLKTHAITNIAWNTETRNFYEEHAPQGLEFYNLRSLFGAVITSTRPVIANEPASDPRSCGLPDGHPAMHCFLGVPLMDGEGMLGMLGMANRPGGYDEELLASIEPLTSTTAMLLRNHRALREA
jgi:GAF domain-containing protein